MKVFIIKHLWWITLLIALCMLIAHVFAIGQVNIDNTSVILLLVIFLSPFISAIRKIKIGDFEAEIDPKEIKRIIDDVETRLPDISGDENSNFEIQNRVMNIQELVEADPILALAKLRIELEKILNKIYRATHRDQDVQRNLSIGKIVYQLSAKEILPSTLRDPISEVVSICNRAIHGEEIREKDASSIVDIGTSLLEQLYFIANDFILEPVEEATITEQELKSYENARYKLVTVIPLVDKPIRNIRHVDQEGLDEFLEGYNEFAEFIISISALGKEKTS